MAAPSGRGRRHRGAPGVPGRRSGRTALPCPAGPACGRAPCPAVPGVRLAGGSGRAGGGRRFRLGPNEVCINEGRQEIQCLNWMLASPTSPHLPSMFLFFSFLRVLEEISRAGPGESRRPLWPLSTLPLGAEALERRPLVPDESCAPAQQWPPARPPFPLRLSNLY